jgi:hypothetical protein
MSRRYLWGITTTTAASAESSAGDNGDIIVRNASNTSAVLACDVIFWAKANPNSVATRREWISTMLVNDAANSLDVAALIGATWNETSTNITSIEIGASSANGIGDGSTLALYKLRQS